MPLGQWGTNLPDWIRAVMRHRQGRFEATTAVSRGLEECLRSGATAVGEIATSDWRPSRDLPSLVPTTVMFREAIGPTVLRARDAAAAAEAFLAASHACAEVLPGLSPHAPYTVHPQLLETLVELSGRFRVPLAMHLAESPEELELLASGSGPFRELLESVGAWEEAAGARLASIFDYLKALARAPRALVIHGNYLNDEEIAFLAEWRESMSVVYCPRTHDYFARGSYPLARMLATGVNVALGTDSRASNPDLSVFEEMRFAAARHAAVDPATILRMGTLDGAHALGIADRSGTIEPGKPANLAIVALSDQRPADPHELLFAPESRVVRVMKRGTSLIFQRTD